MRRRMPRFSERPPRPAQLLLRLQTLFPQFGDEELRREVETGGHGLHWVMMHFAQDFRASQASEDQLRGLSDLIDEAVAQQDDLENAVSTCLLEHLRQIDPGRVLSPYLSKQAKSRMSA